MLTTLYRYEKPHSRISQTMYGIFLLLLNQTAKDHIIEEHQTIEVLQYKSNSSQTKSRSMLNIQL